jgi:hypothetical protein
MRKFLLGFVAGILTLPVGAFAAACLGARHWGGPGKTCAILLRHFGIPGVNTTKECVLS